MEVCVCVCPYQTVISLKLKTMCYLSLYSLFLAVPYLLYQQVLLGYILSYVNFSQSSDILFFLINI